MDDGVRVCRSLRRSAAGAEVLEQQWAQLDDPQCRLASGHHGVHAGTIPVVGAFAAIAVAVEPRGIATGAAIALAGDQVGERLIDKISLSLGR